MQTALDTSFQGLTDKMPYISRVRQRFVLSDRAHVDVPALYSTLGTPVSTFMRSTRETWTSATQVSSGLAEIHISSSVIRAATRCAVALRTSLIRRLREGNRQPEMLVGLELGSV